MPTPSATTTDNPVREAARIARRMKREGKSAPLIAAELGVSEPTVKKWLKYRTPPAAPKPRTPTVTVRRKQFAAALAQGQRPTAAAMAAGCRTLSAAKSFSHDARNSPAWNEYFNGLMDKAGLDEETIAKGLKECSQATKVVGVAVNKQTGMITDTKEHPDYHVRHQTLRTALEVRKRLNSREEDKNPLAAPVHLHLTVELKEKYEAMVGGKLDFDTIDVLPAPPDEKEEQNVVSGNCQPPGVGEEVGQSAGAASEIR